MTPTSTAGEMLPLVIVIFAIGLLPFVAMMVTSYTKIVVVLGLLRAQQGIPFSNLFWAVCIAHEYLWQYMQDECLLEEPVEFWGGVILLRSMTQFFDRVLYFVLRGYEQAAACEPRVASTRFVRGQAS